MSPHVGAVVVDEDGDVAEDADAALSGIGLEGAPLLIEEKLDGLLDGQGAGVVIQDSGQCIVRAAGVLRRPLVPTGVVETTAEHVEHGVVGQPGEVVLAELLVVSALFVVGAIEEVGGGLLDERELESHGFYEVGGAFVARQGL